MSYYCPECKKPTPTEVTDTREADVPPFGKVIRRRRICSRGHRFSTAEVIVSGGRGSGLKVDAQGTMEAAMRQDIGKQLRTFANKFIKGKV